LTLLTITLVSSQSLEIEANHTVEEYLSQLNLARIMHKSLEKGLI
jgi:hypothetical protein